MLICHKTQASKQPTKNYLIILNLIIERNYLKKSGLNTFDFLFSEDFVCKIKCLISNACSTP